MKQDVESYVDRCKTCIRFRKIATKTPQVPVIPRDFECWEEVMVDLEGPCNPPDKHGNRYSMTYICCLCHGIFIEISPKCNAAEVRRMFSNCMMRSGRMPRLVRSDRGPEFKNGLINEYLSLMGAGQRFGNPYRPMEQGLVEGVHKTTQKMMGILVNDVMKCYPSEVGELRHVVEYLVYNTPGPHGYTPKDIDRRWATHSSLTRDLQPFAVPEFGPQLTL